MLKLSFKTCDTQKAGTVGTHFVGGEGGGVNTGTRTLNIEFVGPHASCPPAHARTFALVWFVRLGHFNFTPSRVSLELPPKSHYAPTARHLC